MTEHSSSQLLSAPLQRVLAVAVFALAFYLAVLSVNELKRYAYIGADIPPQATIQVSGEGEVVAVPDVASFTFGVVAQGKDAASAQAQMVERLNAIMAYLRNDIGFTDDELTTTSYTLYPRYEWKPAPRMPCTPEFCPPTEGKRELVGFEARATVRVKTKDFDKARKALGQLASRGATDISSLSFTVEDPEALEAQAREEAIANAKAQALAIARALGISLGRVVAYNEAEWGRPVPFARAEAMVAQGDEAAAEPDIAPGQTTVRKRVTVTYELR